MLYLKLITFPNLINLLFQTQTSSFKNFLYDLLSERFKRIDKDTYELDPEDILYLNKVLENIKSSFSSILRSAPPPFSFFLSKDQTQEHLHILLRSGKIYLEKSLKKEIVSVLENKKIFYKIEPWGDLWELILPSTVDPKIELFYKDIFWCGNNKPCFFCKTTWHSSKDCPALLDPNPRATFQSALNLNFKDLSQILWKDISKGEFSSKNLNFFYTRNFYLLPEFLKLVFFKSENINTWGDLKLDLESPVRGGNLGLGLEYLIKKDLKTAEKIFLEIEDDFRANIGLSLINILKEDLKRAFYHLENALSQPLTPFLKSYLLFLKGYFYEYEGQNVIAEEFYKDALQKDFTCLPAFYYYNLSKYFKNSNLSEIFKYFEHPYFLYWSYFEPVFIRDQKEVEELIYNKIAEKRETASQRLKDAENRYHKIKNFLSESEREEYQKKLSEIGKNIYTGGLGLIENSYHQALVLDLEFQGYIYRVIENIKKDLENIKNISKSLNYFWYRYPYKYEDVSFGKELKDLLDLLQKIEVKIKRKDPSDALSTLISEINTSKKLVENLKIIKTQLAKKWNFRMRLADFLKNFSLFEFFIACVYIIFPYLPISETIKKIFTFPSFLLVSFILLIVCIFLSYSKNYVSE